MDQIRLLRKIYRLRKVIAAFVLLEWLYKAHKSRPALWWAMHRRQHR